jgi:hypothetical protein
MSETLPADEYLHWLQSLKGQILQAQQRAALSVNRELVLHYWRLGSEILRQQRDQGWCITSPASCWNWGRALPSWADNTGWWPNMCSVASTNP